MVSPLSVLLTLVSINCVKGHDWQSNSTFYFSSTNNFDVYPDIDDSSTPLYFGFMLASSDMDHLDSTTITAVQIAVDDINADKDLLRGYSLHYTLTASQCSKSDLTDRTLSQLFGEQGVCKIGFIEAGCTDSRVALARTHLVSQFNIPQITCSPTVQDLTDDLNMFEVSPANDVIVPALVELIAHYKWKKLALIVENKQEYTEVVDPVSIRSLNITLSVMSLSVRNGTISLEDSSGNTLFTAESELENRIFILSMSPEMVNYFLCEAFKSNIRYPKYEFMFVNAQDSDWWVTSNSSQDDLRYGCSTEERAQVLRHSLSVHWRLNQKLNRQDSLRNITDRQALFCYDAVWILAQGLNRTLSSENYDCMYMDQVLAKDYSKSIHGTSFNGITGEIEFGPNRARVGVHNTIEVLVQQYQTASGTNHTGNSMKRVTVGLYRDGNLTLLNDTSLWPKGTPYDGSPVRVVVHMSDSLVIVFYLIASLGIILSIACCIFNFVFRNTRIVRLSSPNLNYLTSTGAVFFYISAYWYCLPSTNSDVVLTACLFQVPSLGIGNLIVIGTIVAKLWRIYYIFRNPNSAIKHTITDCHLFLFVLLLAAVGTLISLIYIIIETAFSDIELKKLPNKDNLLGVVGEREINEHYEYYTCDHVPYVRTITICLLFGIVGILLGCALFMAFKTRKVRIKGLNDAKYITAIVFISSLSVLMFVIFTFTLDGHVDAYPAARTGIILISMTIILGLVFIPKMINLYRDPEGEHIFSNSNNQCPAAQPSVVFLNRVQCKGCQHLKTRVRTLEQLLAMKDRNDCTEGKCVVLHSTNIGFQQSYERHNLTYSTTQEPDDMSFDDLGGIEVSWAEDGCSFHVGHKV